MDRIFTIDNFNSYMTKYICSQSFCVIVLLMVNFIVQFSLHVLKQREKIFCLSISLKIYHTTLFNV